MDINTEVQKAFDKYIEDKLPAVIQDKVGKMLDELIGNIFQSYSDTGKEIKKKIEEKINVNLQEYDLIDYNGLISKAINDKLIESVNENSIKPIMSLVQDTIGFINKKKIKLSEIHQMVMEASMEENDQDGDGAFSFHVSENTENKWYTISFDLDPKLSADECGLEFLISAREKHQRIFIFRAKSHWSNKKQLTPSKLTQLSNLEHKIFRLYSAQVDIEVDELDFYNNWDRYN